MQLLDEKMRLYLKMTHILNFRNHCSHRLDTMKESTDIRTKQQTIHKTRIHHKLI